MKAIKFKDMKISYKILVDFAYSDGDHEYSDLTVIDIDHEKHQVITNLNGGYPMPPNEDDHYIVVNYDEINDPNYLDNWIDRCEKLFNQNQS